MTVSRARERAASRSAEWATAAATDARVSSRRTSALTRPGELSLVSMRPSGGGWYHAPAQPASGAEKGPGEEGRGLLGPQVGEEQQAGRHLVQALEDHGGREAE